MNCRPSYIIYGLWRLMLYRFVYSCLNILLLLLNLAEDYDRHLKTVLLEIIIYK